MAVDTPLQSLGWFMSTADYRNSTVTGTTNNGPNGSGQFCAVSISTAGGGDHYFSLFASALGVPLGILQNKPAAGQAGDIAIWGVTKMVSGSTAIYPGTVLAASSLSASSTMTGRLVPWTASGQYPCAVSFDTVGSVGQIFTGLFYGGAVSS